MQRNNLLNSTKRGGASLYLVIFTALILSVISLSYVRVMLSNASQTSDTDLSQSAYDSAMAGLEDAKIALLKYHDCLSQGYSRNSNESSDIAIICKNVIIEMEDGIANQSCDIVSKVLNRMNLGDQGETMIEETNYTGINNSTDMAQAYTCVRISEELKDYRSTLSESDRIRIVPIRTANYGDVRRIRISWYSDANAQNNNGNYNRVTMIGVDLFQTGKWGFNLGELSTSNADQGTDHAKIFLQPGGNGGGTISARDIIIASDKNTNHYMSGNCAYNSAAVNSPARNGYVCYADLILPDTYYHEDRAESTFFLKLTLPYGYPTTDFSITLCGSSGDCNINSSGSTYDFTGVQSMVDSTGRANDLYRRVETRIELVDNYFPYPEFALQMSKNSEDGINKNFWTTKNCWGANDGEPYGCSNNGDVPQSAF